MKKEENSPYKIESLTDAHRAFGLPAPQHPLRSLINEPSVCSAYTLLIHPDFLLGYPLARTMKQYGFFSYSTHETLHLSEAEKETILEIFAMIEAELNSRIDDSSQDVIIAQLELLLNY